MIKERNEMQSDWHRKPSVCLGTWLFTPLGPLQMQELLLHSLLQMDNQCTLCRDLVLPSWPSLPLFLSEERKSDRRQWLSPTTSLWWQGNLCSAVPALSRHCLKFWHGNNLISTWATGVKRQQTSIHALPLTVPSPPLALLCHQVPTDDTSDICKALQKTKIWKFCCLRNKSHFRSYNGEGSRDVEFVWTLKELNKITAVPSRPHTGTTTLITLWRCGLQTSKPLMVLKLQAPDCRLRRVSKLFACSAWVEIMALWNF